MRALARLAFALFGAIFLLETAAQAENKTFQKPRHNDVRLDWCYSWKVKECGKKVADLFCAARHYTAAADFRQENAGGETRFIGSNESCKDKGCVGFAYITCRGQVDTANNCKPSDKKSTICQDANPTWKGNRLDRCLLSGKNCDGAVAKAYCRSKGYDDFAYYRTDAAYDGSATRSMGTDQVCNGAHCRGFQVIRCKRTAGRPKTTPTDTNATMQWPMTSKYKFKVEFKLFSQTRAVEWPGNNQVYVLDDSKQHMTKVGCNIGEKICYGAWSGNKFWGAGRDGKAACNGCCRTCTHGVVKGTTLTQ